MTRMRMGWWFGVAGVLLLGGAMGAQAVERKAASGTSKTPKETLTAAKLIASLDAVLAEQEQLRLAIEDVRREAEIVKVRTSTPKSCP